MAWVIEIKKLNIPNSFNGLDKSYVTSMRQGGKGCSLTTSFDNAKVYTNRNHVQKSLDFFNRSGIAYQVIPVSDKVKVSRISEEI